MTAVDLAPFYSALNELIIAALTALLGWGVLQIRAWGSAHLKFLDAKTQATLASDLDRALNNGISYAAAQGLVPLETAHSKITVDNPFVAMAARYTATHVPETLAKLGVTPENLPHLIMARLNGIAPAEKLP